MNRDYNVYEDVLEVTENRLRIAMVDFADHPAEQKNEYLSAIIEEGIKQVQPDSRNAFLRHLKERFPTFESFVQTPMQLQTNMDASLAMDPEVWAESAMNRLYDMKPEDRQLFIDKLVQEGFISNSSQSGPVESETLENWIKQHLKTRVEYQLDTQKMDTLLILLLDFVTTLEPKVRGIWKGISTKNVIKQYMTESLALYFKSDDSAQAARQLEESLNNLCAFIIVVLSSIPRMNSFLDDALRKFSPDLIAQAVQAEGVQFFKSKEVAYWGKFIQLYQHVESENEVNNEIINHVMSIWQKHQNKEALK